MMPVHAGKKWVLFAACLVVWGTGAAYAAGVSRVIQDRYRSNYENKALFLKVPLFTEKQYVYISGQTFRQDLPLAAAPRFKVGDQLRVLGIDFGGDEIKFKLGAIAGEGAVELIFKFDSELQENFPNSGVFDKALAATLTEGLRYTELEDAKRTYVEQEFDRAAREIANTSGTNRDTVLKYVAPRLPAYQDAMREIETLQNRTQDLGRQVAQSQAENRKLEAESKSQQSEIARLRSQAAGLQEKIDSSSSQLVKLGDDLRSAQGLSQNYQKELANLQRSLKIRVDSNRDLASQISELGQVMQKLQKDNDSLQTENGSLNADIEKERGANARLSGENQDLKTSVRQKDDMIKTLSSKEDSLARQYLVLQRTKDNLENVTLAVSDLNTRVIEEKTEGGIRTGRIDTYLGDILLGSLEWRLPERLDANQEKSGEAVFSSESIDYVRVTPAQRRVLQSFGERLRMRVRLASGSDTMEVVPEKEENPQEIGERDRGTWHWRIVNHGSHDSRLVLEALLVNKNGDEIPLAQAEQLVLASNLVRQVRDYLQPIPLVLGVILGSLIMGIAGLFRKGKHTPDRKSRPESPSAPYTGRKQL